VTALAMLAGAGSASAAAPTGDFAVFEHCPYTNPAALTCVYTKSTSGSFKLGSTTVPLTASTPMVVQGAFGQEEYPNGAPWFDAVGADSFSTTRLKVPGGLLGLVDRGGLSGLLISLLNAAIASANDVYATVELVGAPQVFPTQLSLTGEGTGLKLPLRIRLENPFLGSGCTIGTASNPINLALTSGVTAPPPPNVPISGDLGTWSFNNDFSVITSTGVKLVDNAFAVPAATNCGRLALTRPLITAAVNAKLGLPSAAGRNEVIQLGTSQVAGADRVGASVQ
jgi:hypothetical protein